ncbi:hypothetical protein ACP5WH_24345 [Enterocloster bolteae]|jgi:hypothetical protein|nr:MAG TPA: hypothetical protein [Caudoviricetes sp.]
MEEISKVLKSNPGLLNLFKVAITCNKAQIVKAVKFLDDSRRSNNRIS